MSSSERTLVKPLRFLLFLAAAGLIFYGITNGSLQDVMAKAAAICLECIGLG